MYRYYSGFTLINLLISLTITSILAFKGVPSLQKLINNSQATNQYNQLFTLIQFTRIQAVNYHSQAILCPTINQTDCINNWSQELMVFIDTNNDEIRNDNEILLRIKPPLKQNEAIHWRASGSLRYLRFKADGSTGNQNGRLSYCLNEAEDIVARQIIMYRSGRARRGSIEAARSHCTT